MLYGEEAEGRLGSWGSWGFWVFYLPKDNDSLNMLCIKIYDSKIFEA